MYELNAIERSAKNDFLADGKRIGKEGWKVTRHVNCLFPRVMSINLLFISLKCLNLMPKEEAAEVPSARISFG